MKTVIVVVAAAVLSACLFAPSSAQLYYQATINASQVVGGSLSNGTGLGCFTLDASYTLHFDISYSGLTSAESASHIHGPAPAGVNAGVQIGLPLGTPKVGSVGPLTIAQFTDLNGGLYYVNIHTVNYPGGEIRGQILAAPGPCTTPVENKTWGAIKGIYDVTQ